MKYEVINGFVDLQDDNYKYSTGDEFPRAGVDVSEDRIAELESTSNKCGIALIKAMDADDSVDEVEDIADDFEEDEVAVEVEEEKKPKKIKNNKKEK